MIHIGHIIKEELQKQDRGATWLANKLCCTRANIYKILEKESIDSHLIERISDALQINMFQIIAEKKKCQQINASKLDTESHNL